MLLRVHGNVPGGTFELESKVVGGGVCMCRGMERAAGMF